MAFVNATFSELELNNASTMITPPPFTTVELFQFYYTPVLVYCGWIGNGLSVIVFSRTKLSKLSSTFYLVALAISDSVFLLSLFVTWLTMIDIDFFNRPGLCQLIVYLTSVCSFLSVWLVLAFTVERFVAVQYPLLRQAVCTVSRAKGCIALLMFIGMILYCPLLLFAQPKYIQERAATLCTIVKKWQKIAGIFAVVDFLITFVIPVLVIVVLNISISRTLWRLGMVRRRLTYARDGTAHSKSKIRRTQQAAVQNKTTKMLLVVSTTCLCLNLPSYIMRILTYLIELQIMDQSPTFLMIQHYSLQLFNTNFAINFALYCIGGQNFRRAIKSLLCKKRLERHGTTAFAISESRTQPTVVARRGRQIIYQEE